jgi:ATP-binding protein involved in chromosome partitioning
MDPRISIIEKRLQSIEHIIPIASGKGGVGKSMVAVGLALQLAKKGCRVGLLDLDMYGPSTHIILGVQNIFPKEEKGLVPPKINGISYMSIVFFTKDKPLPFRGNDITNVIIELLAITQWGSLDYIIIDMPPGIGDETLDVLRFMKKSEFIVVTTPSKVAMGSVEKLLTILKEQHIPILGIIENMKTAPGLYIEKKISQMGLCYRGIISFDKLLEQAIGNPDRLQKTKFMKDLNMIIKKMNLK